MPPVKAGFTELAPVVTSASLACLVSGVTRHNPMLLTGSTPGRARAISQSTESELFNAGKALRTLAVEFGAVRTEVSIALRSTFGMNPGEGALVASDSRMSDEQAADPASLGAIHAPAGSPWT